VTDNSAGLSRKIGSATDLQSVVRTMKALAASSIGQYERSVQALADYCRAVEWGLGVCFRETVPSAPLPQATTRHRAAVIDAIVFGSDQGLVGRYNDIVVDHALTALASLPGEHRIWAVGERVQARLEDAGAAVQGLYAVPNSVRAIAPLVGQILLACERDGPAELHLFHNRPLAGAAYEPASRRLLPLDETWRRSLAAQAWPTGNLPEVVGHRIPTLGAFIREHLFVQLFRACAESLASENASRLAAMERADRNIGDLLETLRGRFNQLRQSGIDEELFDVVSGFDALPESPRR